MRNLFSFLLLAASLLASAAGAQQPRPAVPGALRGIVVDTADDPIENVEVSFPGKSVRTDSAGRFLLAELPSGKEVDITFRRLAYEPLVLQIEVPPRDTARVEIQLNVVAQRLEGMVVKEYAARLRQLEDFEARRKAGFGRFITRAEIEKRHPMQLSDMMRMVPGVVINAPGIGRTGMQFSRNGGRFCPPQFFIDGIQADGFSIDDMPPVDVEGIEIYAGPGGLPPEYNRLHSTVSCGAVIIWTRIPGN